MSDTGCKNNVGRKPKFLSDSETTHIRVPKKLKKQIEQLIEQFDREYVLNTEYPEKI